MTTPLIGNIIIFGGNFAPLGWAFCDGRLLAIAEYTALFSLIGTTYGGDGQTTFALPDLRGRVPIHMGQGPGLSSYVMGQMGGTENVTLISQQVPAHTHSLMSNSAIANTTNPSGNFLAAQPNLQPYSSAASVNALMNPAMISSSGGSQPHNNLMPTIYMNYIIALEGIYPSRN